MTAPEILEVVAFDGALYDQWYAAYAAASRYDRGPDADLWSLTESRAEIQHPSAVVRRRAFVARVGGEVVAAGWLGLPLKDNLHRANVGLFVVPEARRRGHATALLDHLTGEARAEGRSVLNAESWWPYEAGADGTGAPGSEFARARGFDLVLADVRRRLDLPADESRLAQLAAEAAPHHADYELRSWLGPVPEDLVGGWAILDASLETEAPVGGLDLEPALADVASVREEEDLLARQGRTSVATVALASDGSVVAYTQIVVAEEAAAAYQWGTLVRRADRGHRLGLALKVANLRLLQQERPGLAALTTYNAESNAPMVAVNDALGFVPIERLGELQKRL